MRTVAVVLAGGAGSRFGGAVPKQLAYLAGRPMLAYSLAAFDAAPGVDGVLVVAPAAQTAVVEQLVVDGGFAKVHSVVAGGRTRADSTRCGLAAIDGEDGNVLLHDAARPLLSAGLIADCVAALQDEVAVAPALPATDTMLAVDGDRLVDVVDRERLRAAQTPQGFRLTTIRRAHAQAAADPTFTPTDDCSVVLRYLPGTPVRVIPGDSRNIKITTTEDLRLAVALLSQPP
jgi:2-C-methyl-D-erythritol 4-phosphate cytidylyltransferase